MQQVSLVITDLDNTLYDWVEMWFQSFSAMLAELIKTSGIEQSILEPEIRSVFQHHGTSEYTFLIEELPSLQKLHPGKDLKEVYKSAIEAYRTARRESRQLYPTVEDTLKILRKERGCRIIAYTESRAYATMHRIQQLNLDGLIDLVYLAPTHKVPDENSSRYSLPKLKYTKHRFVKEGEFKPNPAILLEIIEQAHEVREKTMYVGDSLMKDIYMAQQAEVTDVFAAYGVAQHREAYEQLRRVSHWKESDVQKEKQIYANLSVKPTYTLQNSFSELLQLFDFVPHRKEIANERTGSI